MKTVYFTDTIVCENCGAKRIDGYRKLNGKYLCRECLSELKNK